MGLNFSNLYKNKTNACDNEHMHDDYLYKHFTDALISTKTKLKFIKISDENNLIEFLCTEHLELFVNIHKCLKFRKDIYIYGNVNSYCDFARRDHIDYHDSLTYLMLNNCNSLHNHKFSHVDYDVLASNYKYNENGQQICKNVNLSIEKLQSMFYKISANLQVEFVTITANNIFKQCSQYLMNKLNNYCDEKLNETNINIAKYTDYINKLKCDINTNNTNNNSEQRVLFEKTNYMCSTYETTLTQLNILKFNLLILKNAIEPTEIFENNMFNNVNKCNEIENNLNVNNTDTYVAYATAPNNLTNNLTNIVTNNSVMQIANVVTNNSVMPIANIITNNINDIPDINMYNLVDVTPTNNTNVPIAQVMS